MKYLNPLMLVPLYIAVAALSLVIWRTAESAPPAASIVRTQYAAIGEIRVTGEVDMLVARIVDLNLVYITLHDNVKTRRDRDYFLVVKAGDVILDRTIVKWTGIFGIPTQISLPVTVPDGISWALILVLVE